MSPLAPRGPLPRDQATGSIPNSMRMSLPKDSGWRRIRQPNKQPDPDRADTLTACLKRPRFRKPGFCGTDWDWRLLILVGSRANHNDGEATPEDRKGAGAPPLSTRISTNAQDQSRDAAAPPCSKSPGMAQAASSNPSIGPSCHKPTGYRRLPGGNVGGVRRACRAFIRAITRLGPNSQFTREQSAKLTAHGDGCRRVQRSPQQGFQPQKPVREPPDPSELREPFTLARRLRPEGCGLRLEGSALSDERAEERIFAA